MRKIISILLVSGLCVGCAWAQEKAVEKGYTEGIFTFKAPSNLTMIQGSKAQSLKSQMMQGGRELAEASGTADPKLFTESSLTFFSAYELAEGELLFILIGNRSPDEMNRDAMFSTNSDRIRWGKDSGKLSSDSKGVFKLDIDGIPSLLMDIVSPEGERLQTYTFFVPDHPKHSFAITFKSPVGKHQSTIDAILGSLKIARAKVSGPNTQVVFNNQSGEPVLVKLTGPMVKEVEVATGAKGTVSAITGRYYIRVRYGTPGKYHYAKGAEFEVKGTATTRSETTITLHRVAAGSYDLRPISETEFGQEGKKPSITIPAGSALFTKKAKTTDSVSLVVPDGWRECTGQEWRKHDVVADGVTEAGKLLGYTDGEPVQHSYWADKDGKFRGIYVRLRDGTHGIQFVPIPPFVAFECPLDIECTYYTFRGMVYSAQPVTLKDKTWPVMSKIMEIDHTFTRKEEKIIAGRRCLRADPIANEVFELGTTLGYSKGEKVGSPFWAEWQSKDDSAKNPVAAYSEAKDSDKDGYIYGNTARNACDITRGGKTYPAGSEVYTFEKVEGQVTITHVSELGRVLGYKVGDKL